MRKTAVLRAAVAAWTVAGHALAAGNAFADRSKAAACGACHGPDGNSGNPLWPKLAGQHAAYLVEPLKAFKSGDRKDPLMSAMAAGLSEKDMQDLAVFHAGRKPRYISYQGGRAALRVPRRLRRQMK